MKVRAQPEVPTGPEIGSLGSSDDGAQVATHFGLPCCFAQRITDGQGAAEALALYRETFRPGVLDRPHAAVAVGRGRSRRFRYALSCNGPLNGRQTGFTVGFPTTHLRRPAPEAARAAVRGLDMGAA